MDWIVDNWEMLLEVVGGASALAFVFAKLTKNKTDDKIVAWVQKALDLVALNQAKKAGDAAVKANPPQGAAGIVGKPKDVE